MKRSLTLAEIAQLLKGSVVGDPARRVRAVAAPDDPHDEALCVVWDRRLLERLPAAIAVLTTPGSAGTGRDAVEVADPRAALAVLLPALVAPPESAPGVHASAVVDATAKVDASATIGPLCVVCAGATIGPRVVLQSQVFVGRNVSIGDDSRIEPMVALLDDTVVGRRALIHSGSVIGSDGFGFVKAPDGTHVKIPQIGRVVIEDDVEIGAMATVDRATLGETRIGRGTKTDDHVHVAHNCRVGQNCLLVAFTGLAGTTTLEDGVVMAARAGTAPHIRVGRGATVAGMGGVTTDIPAGVVVSGFPAHDHKQELRLQALVRRLPELFARVKRLEER